MSFGIAITTYNRRDMVCKLIDRLNALTITPFKLIVCDDGSTDGTTTALRNRGVQVIGGANRGVSWNKNRGIFYLLNVEKCDSLLLLDDDVEPEHRGWELEWLSAITDFGHVNLALSSSFNKVIAGSMTAVDPGLAHVLLGCASGFSASLLGMIGYFDVRFGRYGHEHTDFTNRALRAGYGGLYLKEPGGCQVLYYVIRGGLQLLPADTWGTSEDVAQNGRLMESFRNDEIYRHAWRNDEMMKLFLDEVSTTHGASLQNTVRKNSFNSVQEHFNVRISHLSRKNRPEPAKVFQRITAGVDAAKR